MPFQRPTWARRFSKEDLRLRLYAFPGEEEPTHEYGYWWAEWGGTLDTIKDNETIRDELMSVALGIWDHVKNGPPEGGANVDAMEASCWALDWIGFLPAKRESRRFIGQHVLTEEDLIGSRVFPDAIAYGGWSIDLHPPAGVDAVDEEPCQQFPLPWLYDVPLRSCVARDIENLMFAGRNISATHVAFASTRVMATCAVIGQGVGTAAAYAVERNLTPRQLADNSDALQAIQQRLLLDDAFLIDRPIAHSRDVAQYASVTASSQLPGGEIEQLRSGFTRAVHGPRGVEPGRRLAGSHRWMSDPGRELPQSLLLEWEEACLPQAVQLIFDTGMHRHLTLTHHNGYASRMLWGTPQPETVRDYTIEVLSKSGWNTIVSIENNYLRLRRHLLNLSEPIRALRLQVTATNGLDHARVFDIRVLTSADPWSECL
jgi:hypothetical protein